MGDRYGPMVVAPRDYSIEQLRGLTIAVPGTLTTAFLTLQLCLGRPASDVKVPYVIVPFDQIIDVVEAGEWHGKPVQAGLVIHEGQLTYGDRGLRLAVDLGEWWYQQTGLPLPLGAPLLQLLLSLQLLFAPPPPFQFSTAGGGTLPFAARAIAA